MSITVRLNDDPKYAEVHFSGRLSGDELMKGATAALASARGHGTHRMLSDCRTLEGGHSVVDLYRLVEELARDPVQPRLREALILPEQAAAAEDVRFWEDACRNRGIAARVFGNREDALTWLLG